MTGDTGPLLRAIDESLAMIGGGGGRAVAVPDMPSLTSLLDRCRAIEARNQDAVEPLRTLHHFACTGGTVISKCLAVLPNTTVLSELDPLSMLGVNPKNPNFAPTDLVGHMRLGIRPFSDDSCAEVFLNGLRALLHQCDLEGRRLVLRDHVHSHYCHGPVRPRPTMRALVSKTRRTLSVVTVRNPMDSYLSLIRLNWRHFTPATLDQYVRRYHAFLDEFAGLPIYRYEDFVANPPDVLQAICGDLSLPFDPLAPDISDMARMTGDSGRSGGPIKPRAAKEIPPALIEEAAQSVAYKSLLSRLGY